MCAKYNQLWTPKNIAERSPTFVRLKFEFTWWANIIVAGVCVCIISNTGSTVIRSLLTDYPVSHLCATATGH